MKPLQLIFLCLFCYVLPAQAQIEKGAWMLGGNGNINVDFDFNSSGGDSFETNLNPVLGYFVSNRIMLGLSPKIYYFTGKASGVFILGSPRFHSFDLGLGPLARVYIFSNPNRKIKAFTQLGGTFSREFTRSNQNSSDRKRNFHSRDYHAGLGINYFLTSQIALEAILNYSYRNGFSSYTGESERFSEFIDRDLNLNFGLQIFLASKKN